MNEISKPVGNSIKSDENSVKNSPNQAKGTIQEQIIALICKLKKEGISPGLSYSQIGEKCELNKAAVYQIQKRKWFPKKKERQQKILEKLTFIPNNSDID